MEIQYYDVIAAKMFGVEPKELYGKSQKGEIKTPRFFCMKYIKEILGHSNAVAGNRYNRHHSTVNNARKRVQEWIDTNDKLAILYVDFLDKCHEYKIHNEFLSVAQKDRLLFDVSMGWFDYIRNVIAPITTLTELLFKNDNEDMIREHIHIVEEKLNELKFLYKVGNEPQL
jgi:hypothetical protein